MKTESEIQREYKRYRDLIAEVKQNIETETDEEKIAAEKFRLEAIEDAFKWFKIDHEPKESVK